MTLYSVGLNGWSENYTHLIYLYLYRAINECNRCIYFPSKIVEKQLVCSILKCRVIRQSDQSEPGVCMECTELSINRIARFNQAVLLGPKWFIECFYYSVFIQNVSIRHEMCELCQCKMLSEMMYYSFRQDNVAVSPFNLAGRSTASITALNRLHSV